MAKSLRSKWKRKMRAVKRERYGEKELKRLNEMLAKAGDYQFCPEIKEENADGALPPSTPAPIVIDIEENDEKPTFIPNAAHRARKSRIDSRKGRKPSESETPNTEKVEKMSVDGVERIFNKRTMRDQFGNYPDWMNKRKMRTQQKKNKRLKKRAQSVGSKRK